jgi:hypothetical protein
MHAACFLQAGAHCRDTLPDSRRCFHSRNMLLFPPVSMQHLVPPSGRACGAPSSSATPTRTLHSRLLHLLTLLSAYWRRILSTARSVPRDQPSCTHLFNALQLNSSMSVAPLRITHTGRVSSVGTLRRASTQSQSTRTCRSDGGFINGFRFHLSATSAPPQRYPPKYVRHHLLL